MNETDKPGLMELFAEAVDLDDRGRQALIERVEQDDPQLADKLRGLIAADRSEGPSLHQPIVQAAQSLAAEEEDRWLGRKIGPWTIRRRIGAGGMGAVFYAERSDDSYRQGAALKIMAAQLLDKEGAARFRAERQILANLQHPHITRLVDGGTTDEGLPYLVMSYVEGERVDLFCDRKALSVAQRLRLFTEICEAVDFAHRNLVVHRDLKPSNILIDETGAPQLLDFGIAKLIDQDQLDLTMVRTSVDARVMTPEYASPEQVRGEPVSIATDVYALGVLLYRLLTGRSPYGSGHSSAHSLSTAILSEDPKKPSSVVTGETAAADLSRQRGLRPEQLRGTLSGDLDNIILKCLQKEPERRYRTASDLADDIARHLNRQPIEARGDDWAYKTRKFIRRRAIPLGVAAGVVAIVAGLTSFYTSRLADERDQARIAAQQSEEVSSFLTQLFAAAAPNAAPGEDVTATDLLETGRERVDELAGQPEVQAELLHVIGQSYRRLGKDDQAAELLRRAVTLREDRALTEPFELRDSLMELAYALSRQGNVSTLDEAEALMRRAIDIQQDHSDPDDPALAIVLTGLGEVLLYQDRGEEALGIFREALDLASGRLPDSELLGMTRGLATALGITDRFEESKPIQMSAIALSEDVNGPLHSDTIAALGSFGISLSYSGAYAEAIPILEEAADRAAEALGPGHPISLSILGEYAFALMEAGDFALAAETARTNAEAAEQAQGPEHPDTLLYLIYSGEIERNTGRMDSARKRTEEALRRLERLEVPNATLQTYAQTNLLSILMLNGQFSEVIRQANELLGSGGPFIERRAFRLLRIRAEAESQLDRHTDAVMSIGEAIGKFEANPTPLAQDRLSLRLAEAQVHCRAGNLTDARAGLDATLGIALSEFGPDSWRTWLIELEHARLLLAEGRATEAAALARETMAKLEPLFPASDLRLALPDGLL